MQTDLEFATTLKLIASGELDASKMVTGSVGLDGVVDAFEQLESPNTHAKIVVVPGLHAQAAYFLLFGRVFAPFHQKQVHLEGFWLKRAAI